MRVLIADDHARMRGAIEALVRGHLKKTDEVSQCSDGQQAVERFRELRPDWVLMDIEMDPMDGFTASKEILSIDPEARIIFVSQHDDQAYREAAKELGVKGYVLKTDLLCLIPLLRSGGGKKRKVECG